jgi:hypothetical protein
MRLFRGAFCLLVGKGARRDRRTAVNKKRSSALSRPKDRKVLSGRGGLWSWAWGTTTFLMSVSLEGGPFAEGWVTVSMVG